MRSAAVRACATTASQDAVAYSSAPSRGLGRGGESLVPGVYRRSTLALRRRRPSHQTAVVGGSAAQRRSGTTTGAVLEDVDRQTPGSSALTGRPDKRRAPRKPQPP